MDRGWGTRCDTQMKIRRVAIRGVAIGRLIEILRSSKSHYVTFLHMRDVNRMLSLTVTPRF